MFRIWVCLQNFPGLKHSSSLCDVAGELYTECWNGCGYIRWIQQESLHFSNQSPCACCLAASVWVSVQGCSCMWGLVFHMEII